MYTPFENSTTRIAIVSTLKYNFERSSKNLFHGTASTTYFCLVTICYLHGHKKGWVKPTDQCCVVIDLSGCPHSPIHSSRTGVKELLILHSPEFWQQQPQVILSMNHCFWTELSVCHSTLCGLALAILVHTVI